MILLMVGHRNTPGHDDAPTLNTNATQQRNQIKVGTASTKHRKSNSLNYKVVIGAQQQRLSQPGDISQKEEAIEMSPGGSQPART